MKITLFTSNDKRHNFFINMLSEVSEELFVVQECKTIFPGIIPGSYPVTETMKKYFVTGSEGFIGSSLVEKLLKQRNIVFALVNYNSFGNIGWLRELSLKNKICGFFISTNLLYQLYFLKTFDLH